MSRNPASRERRLLRVFPTTLYFWRRRYGLSFRAAMITSDSLPSPLAQLRRGGAVGFVLNGLAAGAMFLMHVAAASATTPAEYGVFTHALAVTALAATAATLGAAPALLRFVPEHQESGRWDLVRGALLRSHQIAVVGALVGAAALWLSSLHPSCSEGLAMSLRLSAVILPLHAVERVRQASLRALHALTAALLPVGIALPLVVAAIAFVDDGVVLATLYPTVLAVCVACGLVALVACVPSAERRWSATYQTRAWLTVALPLVGGQLAYIGLQRVPTVVLGLVATFDEVAGFSLAMRLSLLLVFVLTAINTIAVPILARAHATGDRASLLAVFRQVRRWSRLGSLPAALVMLLFAESLLGAIAAPYISAAPVLRILALGQLVTAALGPVGVTLTVCGGERAFARSALLVTSALAVACFAVIPSGGSIGAAIATCAATITLSVWQWLAARRLLAPASGRVAAD